MFLIFYSGFPEGDQEHDVEHPSFARYRPTIRATGRVAALIRRFESMPRLSDSESDSAEPRADSPTILVWMPNNDHNWSLFLSVHELLLLNQGCQMAKFDPFLSLDCARVEGVGAQSKEGKGSNFAA